MCKVMASKEVTCGKRRGAHQMYHLNVDLQLAESVTVGLQNSHDNSVISLIL